MSTSCKTFFLALVVCSIAWVGQAAGQQPPVDPGRKLSDPASGQQPAANSGRKLIVTGSASVAVKPDAARIVFDVSSTDKAGTVREANNKHVQKIKKAITDLNFKNVDIAVFPTMANNSFPQVYGPYGGMGTYPGGFGSSSTPAGPPLRIPSPSPRINLLLPLPVAG